MKIARAVLKTTTTILVILAVLIAFLLVGVKLFGFQVYTVLSGSMEPEIPTGSIIYVKKVDPYTLQERQVITFYLEGGIVATHRIIEVVDDPENPGSRCYRTQGDANESPDGLLVRPSGVIGTPVFTIPFLGYVAYYIQQPPGLYTAIAVAALLIALVFLSDGLFASDEEEQKKKKALPAEKADSSFDEKSADDTLADTSPLSKEDSSDPKDPA